MFNLYVIIDEGKIRRKSKTAMGWGGAFPTSEIKTGLRGRKVKLSPTARRAEKMRFIVGYAVFITGVLAVIALLHLLLTQGASLPQSMAKASVKMSGAGQPVSVEEVNVTFAPKDGKLPIRSGNKE